MIGIIKGDERYAYLHYMLENSILSTKLEDFYDVDMLILPMKGIDNDDIIYGTNINLNNILHNNRIRTIIVGNANNKLKAICSDNQIRLFELMKDYIFVKENACLTAKGVIPYLLDGVKDISDNKVLILGYGNISYYLIKLMNAYNTNVLVFPMNEFEKKQLVLNDIAIENSINDSYDIIINTVPKNFNVDYNILKGKVKIFDLASYPYGFNPVDIERYGIDYHILPQIPAKYAPKSAALLIKKYICRINSIV